MTLNDKAVLTAAVGYIYTSDVGTPAPTPDEIGSFDPNKFGANHYTVAAGTAPTSGTFTLSYDGVATADLPFDAAAGKVQKELHALADVPDGTFVVEGGPLGTEAFEIYVFGDGELTADGASLDGGAGSLTATKSGSANGWRNIGHTSRGTLPEFGNDGGDTEVKGTWQNESLREVETETLVEYVTFVSNQLSEDSLTFYYGRNAANEPGVFGVASGNRAPVERSFLVVIQDGDVAIAVHAPKVSIKRDDAIALAVDEFTEIPIRATFLKFANRRLFDWISPDTGLGTAADAGGGSGNP